MYILEHNVMNPRESITKLKSRKNIITSTFEATYVSAHPISLPSEMCFFICSGFKN